MIALSPAQRRELRAKAHCLDPVVSVGQHGLTAAVLHEIDVNLLAHELIKVRVFSDNRDERDALHERICAELDAAPVQHIGKLLVVWRPAPKDEARSAPKAGRGRRDAATAIGKSTAKSTPQVRRPREPTPRTPARPPKGGARRPRSGSGTPVPGGRRRRRTA